MSQDLEKLLELALKNGASHAEVYHSESISYPVTFEANRLKQLETAQSEGTALRVWKNGSPGLAVGYGEIDPQILIDKALSLTKINPPEEILLTENKSYNLTSESDNISVKRLIEIGQETIEQLREKYAEVICSAELEWEEETTTLINSRGLQCNLKDAGISYFLGVELVRGEDFLGIYDGEYQRHIPNPEKVINSILQRLKWAENNTSPPIKDVPVLFTANAATMLWETIGEALNGKRVLEKSSPWSEHLGKIVVSDCLTLTQEPDFAPYNCPFDDEGIITKKLALVTQGKLEQFYTNLTVAKNLGLETTGNGFRSSLGVYPNPDLVNLIIQPVNKSLLDLIKTMKNGLIVDQILGGGPDISGDFSINVDLGYRIENGEIVGRVKDTMVSGNVYEALNEVVAIGNDNRWQSSCYTPSLIVETLSIIG
jgi:PmbA protein